MVIPSYPTSLGLRYTHWNPVGPLEDVVGEEKDGDADLM